MDEKLHYPISSALLWTVGMTYPIGRFQWNLALDSYILVDTPKPSSLGDLLIILLNSTHQAEVRE
jgi:hypothetical protein